MIRRWQRRRHRRISRGIGSTSPRILDDAASTRVATFVVSRHHFDDQTINDKLGVLVEAQADVCARRSVPFVDCYSPLLGHDQWRSRISPRRSCPHHPGQAGYGLIAWLVLLATAGTSGSPLTPPLDVAVRR